MKRPFTFGTGTAFWSAFSFKSSSFAAFFSFSILSFTAAASAISLSFLVFSAIFSAFAYSYFCFFSSIACCLTCKSLSWLAFRIRSLRSLYSSSSCFLASRYFLRWLLLIDCIANSPLSPTISLPALTSSADFLETLTSSCGVSIS